MADAQAAELAHCRPSRDPGAQADDAGTPPRPPLTLCRFEPERYAFPPPLVPLLPFEQQLSFEKSLSRPMPGTAWRHFRRGRYALAAAYRLAGVGPGSDLLAPAYHCVTMLDPAIAAGAAVRLYPMLEDLSPDLSRLDAIVDASPVPVAALLATHFFGVIKDFSVLRRWCERRGIVLIEDCSHVLFTERVRAAGAGQYGRFVTSSPCKFFACDDGGLLFAREGHRLDGVSCASPAWADELRGLKRVAERRWAGFRRPGAVAAPAVDPVTRSSPDGSDGEGARAYTSPSGQYLPEIAGQASLRSSRFIVQHASLSRLVHRRRENYRRWSEWAARLPHCRVLYPRLSDDCIPYMFALRLERPGQHFERLKRLGLPIWRWDELALSPCAVSAAYRLELLHLPCHQSLDDRQMDWMAAVLAAVLRNEPVLQA